MSQPATREQVQTSFISQYILKFKGAKRTAPLVTPVPLDMILTFVSSFIALSLLSILTFYFELPLLTASFGASVVLVFGASDGPLAQPRNVIFGHTFSAIVGVITYYSFGLSWWSIALGTSIAIIVMILTKTTHPPGGATALFAILYEVEPIYILTPIFVGAMILVVLGVIFNNLSPNKGYPRYWY